jgi:DUF4097 and DUF4098 domain-containing protein YvlB/uncharacterized membrane protein HdeD (DUF308 family)
MIKRIATLLLGIGLIGLGVLFFAAPEGSTAIRMLMRFWPVFLILAGIVRVAGFLIDRHPKSPVGGMLVTALGGVLLSANLLAHNSLLLVIGKYWFWFLLALVAGRVMKQSLHRPSDGLRPRAFSPGAIAAMVLIVGSGLAANYFIRSGRQINLRLGKFGEVRDFMFGNQLAVEDEPPQSFEIGPDSRLVLNNINGDIEVTAAPQQTATARIIKRIRAVSEEEAREAAKNIHLRIASDGGNHQISIDAGSIQQDFTSVVILTLPQNLAAHLEINNALGGVKLGGLHGNHIIRNSERIEIQRNEGRVSVENPRGEIEMNQISGDVSIANSRRNVGLQAIAGKVTLDVKGGNVNAEAITGNMQLRAADARLELSRVGDDAHSVSLTIEEARNCRVNLQAIKANVAITAERSRVEAEDIAGNLSVTGSGERIVANRVKGALRIKAENGAVEVEEMRGPATIEATRDVTVRDFRGPLQIDSRQGTIRLETDQKLSGDLKASSDRGRIRVSLPEDCGFRLDASTGRGRVKINGFDAVKLRRDDRSALLGYNVTESAPVVNLRSGAGDIQLQSSGLALASRDDDNE